MRCNCWMEKDSDCCNFGEVAVNDGLVMLQMSRVIFGSTGMYLIGV